MSAGVKWLPLVRVRHFEIEDEMPVLLERPKAQEVKVWQGFEGPGREEAHGIVVKNNPIQLFDPLGLLEPDDPTAPAETNAVNQIPANDPDAGSLPDDFNPKDPNKGKGLSCQGPLGTRIFQISYDCQPIIRLDYGPYGGTHGQPRLHLHLPTLFPGVHIPLDPRSIFD